MRSLRSFAENVSFELLFDLASFEKPFFFLPYRRFLYHFLRPIFSNVCKVIDEWPNVCRSDGWYPGTGLMFNLADFSEARFLNSSPTSQSIHVSKKYGSSHIRWYRYSSNEVAAN
mmetsp:Transcript_3903/g.8977  ORF Transcript_3903/g.8977 Transcript_3903/m.8977 type:complete len:115 (-) Transcript_3903:1329-1673(-)